MNAVLSNNQHTSCPNFGLYYHSSIKGISASWKIKLILRPGQEIHEMSLEYLVMTINKKAHEHTHKHTNTSTHTLMGYVREKQVPTERVP